MKFILRLELSSLRFQFSPILILRIQCLPTFFLRKSRFEIWNFMAHLRSNSSEISGLKAMLGRLSLTHFSLFRLMSFKNLSKF